MISHAGNHERLLRKWLRVHDLGIVAMAVYALRARRFVNHDGFVGDELGLNVTFVTSEVGVSAGEGKVGASFVVEGRRHPALGIVAIGAASFTVFSCKLGIVSVVMASLALLGRSLET